MKEKGDGDEMTEKPFSLNSYQERSESVSDGRPAGAQSRRTASVLCEEKVCSAVVCSQCV